MNSLEDNKVIELIGGIKNALNRGETLENAIQSLKNAGYNEVEVIEASKKLKIIREVKEQKKVIKEKPRGMLSKLKNLFSKKQKTIPQKTNQSTINKEKIKPKILPVKKIQIKSKNNFFGLRKLFSKKQIPHPQKTIPQEILPQKTIPQKNNLPTINQKIPSIKKPKSKRLIWIIVIILSTLVLIGSAILGLYWDKWFG